MLQNYQLIKSEVITSDPIAWLEDCTGHYRFRQ